MTKRQSVGWIYFVVILATLLMRISSSLDVYSALGIENADAFFTCVVQILIFGVLPLFLYCISARHREDGVKVLLDDFGVKKISVKNAFRVVVIGVCMIVLSTALSYIWQIVLMMIGFTHISSPTDYTSVGVLVRELVLVAVLPGLFEEISHRGLIYAGYKECKWKFVIISALLFSLMHQNIVQTGYTFFSGAVMALAMYYTGSIWCGIFMHFLNNAWAVCSEYISQNGGVFSFVTDVQDFLLGSIKGLLISLLLNIACLAIMVLLFVRMRKDAVKKDMVSPKPFERMSLDIKSPWADLPTILTILVGVVATIFSFVWGVTR